MSTKDEDINNYKEIIRRHYAEEARERQLGLDSTMPDLNVRMLEMQNVLKYLDDNTDCLEVGCGNGAASVEICKMKKLNLLAVDVTKEMIDLAKKRSLGGVRGRVEFRHQDILEFDQPGSFDTVYTTRCIINILNWSDQKRAMENMVRALRPGGRLVLLEAFSDGLQELNQARKEVGLDPIPPASHNLHLDKEQVKQHLAQCGMEFQVENNFLSSYYFGTRVLYPAIVKANNVGLTRNSKFDSFFSHFPPYGNFAHIKLMVFKKKYRP